MKSPAVAIAAAFGCGIALGLHPVVEKNAASRFLIGELVCASAAVLATGFLLIRWQYMICAATSSLLAWALMRFCEALLMEQPRPAGHTISLVS